MTAINFTFTAQQAHIVTDTAVSGSTSDLFGTKALAFPHMRLVVAGAGHRIVLCDWITMLLSDLPVLDIEDLDSVAPDSLRRIWTRRGCSHQTAIYHFGADRAGDICAFAYQSGNDFASERVAPGTYLSPGFITHPLQPAPMIEHTAPQVDTPLPAPTWRDRVRATIEAMPRQQREATVRIGGRIQCTYLSPDCIHQNWLGELPSLALEAAA